MTLLARSGRSRRPADRTLLWVAAGREVDVAAAGMILAAGVKDAAPWALFPQREELRKAARWRRCLTRHGVNPRSSGWEHLVARTTGPRAGWVRLAVALRLCAPLSVHPWWL